PAAIAIVRNSVVIILGPLSYIVSPLVSRTASVGIDNVREKKSGFVSQVELQFRGAVISACSTGRTLRTAHRNSIPAASRSAALQFLARCKRAAQSSAAA